MQLLPVFRKILVFVILMVHKHQFITVIFFKRKGEKKEEKMKEEVLMFKQLAKHYDCSCCVK